MSEPTVINFRVTSSPASGSTVRIEPVRLDHEPEPPVPTVPLWRALLPFAGVWGVLGLLAGIFGFLQAVS